MEKQNRIKAVPFLLIVKQFAFMYDIPFFTIKQQFKAVQYYKESIGAAK